MATKSNSSPKKKPVTAKEILNQLQPIFTGVGGFALANIAINAANKMLKIDPTATPEKGLKRLIPLAPPSIVAAGSAFGYLKIDHPIAKNLLLGAAISGTIKTMRAAAPAHTTYLAGDTLGLTPVAAIANTDRWLYQDRTPISGMGFPHLGNVQPPESANGYYLDPPAYMNGDEPELQGSFRGAEEQFYGNDEDLSGQDDGYGQMSGDDDIL